MDLLVIRKRASRQVLPSEPVWDQRTIMLVGERPEVQRICREWEDVGWQVMTIDQGPPTDAGHATHVVRVAVPPLGWQTTRQLLAEPEVEV
jgi:hypothetical protein